MTDTQPKATRPPRQEQEPASEEVTEVSPGVLRMQLPIWMPGLGHVNMYGLVDERGLTVIDPGLPGPQSWKALKQRLKTAGYKLKDVHTVVVTHSHPDHFGGAGRIARETGAELITHHAFSTFTVKGPSPHRALTEGEAKRAEIEAAALAQSLDVEPDELPTINDDADLVHDDTEETESTSSPWGAVTPWGTTNQGPPLRRKMMFRAMRLLFTPPEPPSGCTTARAFAWAAATGSRCTRPATPSTTSARGIRSRACCSPAITCCRRSRRTCRVCVTPTR